MVTESGNEVKEQGKTNGKTIAWLVEILQENGIRVVQEFERDETPYYPTPNHHSRAGRNPVPVSPGPHTVIALTPSFLRRQESSPRLLSFPLPEGEGQGEGVPRPNRHPRAGGNPDPVTRAPTLAP